MDYPASSGQLRVLLRLVTQALLVAVGFHPLLALVFVDLGLTTFLQ